MPDILLLEFEKGYHIGWRESRDVIDHTTVLRSLIYLSYLTGSNKCIDLLEKAELRASALLPAPIVDGIAKPLLPFPRLPSYIKVSELRRLWATPQVVKRVLDFVNRCLSSSSTPAVCRVDDREIEIVCIEQSEGLKFKRLGDVVCIDVDCNGFSVEHKELFERIEEHRNRIDRVTEAADVFLVEGIRPRTPLWIVVEGDEEAVECAKNLVKLLEQLGLGGMRSRGWGRFKVLDAKIDMEFHKILISSLGWVRGLNLLLGSMPPGSWTDLSRSFLDISTVAGRAGPTHDEYLLPMIKVFDIGSLVYAEEIPSPRILSLNSGRATLIFNPVVLHG